MRRVDAACRPERSVNPRSGCIRGTAIVGNDGLAIPDVHWGPPEQRRLAAQRGKPSPKFSFHFETGHQPALRHNLCLRQAGGGDCRMSANIKVPVTGCISGSYLALPIGPA